MSEAAQLGVAYARFALTPPSHLRIMFGPEIRDKTAHPAPADAAGIAEPLAAIAPS